MLEIKYKPQNPELFFPAEFQRRLTAVEPLSDDDSKNEAWKYREVGVTQVYKILPVIIFPRFTNYHTFEMWPIHEFN